MDPLRNLLNLADGKRQYVIDSDHVTQEEFEAVAVMSDVLWGQEGLAEMLGSTWRMVHDPRFTALERCGIYDQKNMFSPGSRSMGTITVKSGDLFGSAGSIDDMTIYAELLGEGRHFKQVAEALGWDPAAPLSADQIEQLLNQECPNYKRRDGSWNRAATTLRELLSYGLVSLVTDYADVAYCTDWINVDTNEVVEPGQRLRVIEEDGFESEDETPVIAVEVDNLYRALSLRAQVRVTAYKLLQQLPGVKKDELAELSFTDLESDRVCQLLFSAKFDKLYTVLLPLAGIVQAARARSYGERLEAETRALQATSQAFNAKLKSGEVAPICTPIEEAPEGDSTAFMFQLTQNPYYAGLFQALQRLEAQGSTEATALAEELIQLSGAGDTWGRISKLVNTPLDTESATAHLREQQEADVAELTKLAEVHGTEWQAKSTAPGEPAAAEVTMADQVFDGVASALFEFVYLNPRPDPRGHRTAIVDLHREDSSLARRTWSIAPEHYRTLAEQTEGGAPIETRKWNRTTDHATGKVSFTLVQA